MTPGLTHLFRQLALGVSLVLPSVAWPQSALPEAEAKQIRDRYYKLLHNANSVHLVEQAEFGSDSVRDEEWLLKPNLARGIISGTHLGLMQPVIRTYCLPTLIYEVRAQEKTYSIFDRIPGGPFLNGLEPFVAPKRPEYTVSGRVLHAVFKGKPVLALETGEQSIRGSMVLVYMDPTTLIPLGWAYVLRGRSETYTYTRFVIDEAMRSVDFQWKPPRDFKLRTDLRHKRI